MDSLRLVFKPARKGGFIGVYPSGDRPWDPHFSVRGWNPEPGKVYPVEIVKTIHRERGPIYIVAPIRPSKEEAAVLEQLRERIPAYTAAWKQWVEEARSIWASRPFDTTRFARRRVSVRCIAPDSSTGEAETASGNDVWTQDYLVMEDEFFAARARHAAAVTEEIDRRLGERYGRLHREDRELRNMYRQVREDLRYDLPPFIGQGPYGDLKREVSSGNLKHGSPWDFHRVDGLSVMSESEYSKAKEQGSIVAE